MEGRFTSKLVNKFVLYDEHNRCSMEMLVKSIVFVKLLLTVTVSKGFLIMGHMIMIMTP